MNSVMISCWQRASGERARTLTELGALGITPVVTESSCDPAGPSLNRHAAWHALSNAPPGPVLFVEDDITPSEHLPWALEAAQDLDVLLDLNLKRRRLLEGALTIAGIGSITFQRLAREQVEQRRGWFGTQCVYLPEHAVEVVKAAKADFVNTDATPKPAEHGFDFWLKEHAEELGGMHALDPPAVHHRNPPSMRVLTRPAT